MSGPGKEARVVGCAVSVRVKLIATIAFEFDSFTSAPLSTCELSGGQYLCRLNGTVICRKDSQERTLERGGIWVNHPRRIPVG